MNLGRGAICPVARAPVACKRRQRNKGRRISCPWGPHSALQVLGDGAVVPGKIGFGTMSNLTFNKIAGAGLATALAIVGLREITTGLFNVEAPEKPGYLIEATVEGGGDAPVAEVIPDFGTVLPVADVKAGEAVFAKCQACHNIANGGANGTGPNLWAVVGMKPGVHAGFAYSTAMIEFGAKQPVWDDLHLYEYLRAPQKYIPGGASGPDRGRSSRRCGFRRWCGSSRRHQARGLSFIVRRGQLGPGRVRARGRLKAVGSPPPDSRILSIASLRGSCATAM